MGFTGKMCHDLANKISAVNYYLDNDVSMDYVCNIFNCKKQSLSRWVKRYNINKSIKRNTRKVTKIIIS